MRLSAPVYQLKRQAKLLARKQQIPLHEAQNRIARDEGFTSWSLLSSRMATEAPSATLLTQLVEGDMLLIGARPGHGKTLQGLKLLLDAAHEGWRSVFFTLEYTEQQVLDRFRTLGGTAAGNMPEIVTSDEICADFIVRYLAGSPRRTIAVVDYLQILDQQRSKPPLTDQIVALKAFASDTGMIFGFISQIDRSFDPERGLLPKLADIRLPNPIQVGIFSRACFLHAGEIRVQPVV